MVNKRPLSGMEKEGTEEIEFVTPNMLLTGYDLNMCPNYTLPKVGRRLIQSRQDIIHFTRQMKSIYARVWGKFIMSYVENLNVYKKKNQTANEIKPGDYVIYSAMNKEMNPINVYQICRVLQILKGRNGDGQIRSLRVKMIQGGKPKEFTRNIRRFSLLELNGDNEPPEPASEAVSSNQ